MVVTIVAFALCHAFPAQAADHFLAIGGGDSPADNQVSLEKNILFFRDALTTLGMQNAPADVLFADGNAKSNDVQFSLPDEQIPKAASMLADVFPDADNLTERFRPHEIPNLFGAAQMQQLKRWFDTVGAKIPDGDRLIIYYTGHGGPGKPPRNTTFVLWNEPDVTVKQFAGLLDRLPAKVSVVLVMVQCYSGGFADVIFDQGDSKRGLSPRNRCGFFATTFDRTAAGCTPDILLDDYKDYSTYFWAALCGHTRTGKRVEQPCFDGNKNIGLAEAHAYTLVHSETVDIPVKTSDRFLQHFSKLSGAGMITTDLPWPKLYKLAGSTDRAVLDGLSERLKLAGDNRVADAHKLAAEFRQTTDNLSHQADEINDTIGKDRQSLQVLLKERWPALKDPDSEDAGKLIAREETQIESFLNQSPEFQQMEKRIEKSNDLDDQADQSERQWVRCQRFLNVVKSLVRAANLQSVAGKEIEQRYEQLLAAENAPLNRP